MPPGHFEKVIVQRGTIIMFMPGAAGVWAPIIPVGPVIGMPVIGIPGIPVVARSIILACGHPRLLRCGIIPLQSISSGRGGLIVPTSRGGFQVRECEFQTGEHGHPDQHFDNRRRSKESGSE